MGESGVKTEGMNEGEGKKTRLPCLVEDLNQGHPTYKARVTSSIPQDIASAIHIFHGYK